MSLEPEQVIAVNCQDDVVKARQLARTMSEQLGFSLIVQTKMVTAVSELARNLLEHGGGGSIHFRAVNNGLRQGLKATFKDAGPGIGNVELALTDGYSTAGGLGLGLGGARRLVHEFTVDSGPGQGTKVTIAIWR